jgi:Ser/Thr protein kinase RdoA (MazF antagonist)
VIAPPPAVLAAWGFAPGDAEPLTGGLINATFAIRHGQSGAPVAVLQRLHPVFAGEVNLDLEAVTAHLAARGLVTPRLIRTRSGAPWIEDGGVWRALTWIDGVAVHAVPDPRWAEAGGALVARFHRAVTDLVHDYAFTRAGIHDTAAHLGRLRERLAAGGDGELAAAVALGHEILTSAAGLPALGDLPARHAHGDLKISNLLFDPAATEPTARCLVDLDTLGRMTIAFELGDAMRSWCNPHREDAAQSRFDLAVFAAAMAGYRREAGSLLGRDERISIVTGLETVCVELAARFCVDAFEDRYFGWDAARFPSRRAHHLARAAGQLALARSVRDQRSDALDAVLIGT